MDILQVKVTEAWTGLQTQQHMAILELFVWEFRNLKHKVGTNNSSKRNVDSLFKKFQSF